MISFKRIGRAVGLAAVFGAALYCVVYVMASRGEAFEFVELKIMNSEAVKMQAGEIKGVSLNLFGPYHQRTVGSDEWVSMAVDVTGSTKNLTLDVKVVKANGVWTFESATSGEKQVDVK